METTGEILLNGNTMTKRDSSNFGYVRQDDHHFGYLTVKEIMYISAWLRLPPSVSSAEKHARVETILHDLGLWKCRDTRIGSSMIKGISGGERKRLSVGVELITDPGVLFLDEPTSGLDSTMSLTLFRRLSKIRELLQRPIITTLHQPSAKMFATFDLLLLLSEGSTVYFGPAEEAIGYFSGLGLHPPAVCNPADFFLDLCSIGAAASAQVVEEGITVDSDVPLSHGYLISKWTEHAGANQHSSSAIGPAVDGVRSSRRYATSFWTQFFVLTWRAWLGFSRSREMLVGMVFKFIMMSLLVGLIFLQVKRDQAGVSNRESAIFFIIIQMTTGPLMSYLSTFGVERSIISHERDGKWYRVSPYFLGKMVAEIFMAVVLPLIYLLVCYWMIGLYPAASNFFSFWGVLCLVYLCGSALAMCLSAITPNFQVAGMMGSLILLFLMILSGFFVQSSSVPVFLRWIEKVSFVKYGYQLLGHIEFSSIDSFYCTDNQLIRGICPIETGAQALRSSGIGDVDVGQNVAIMVALLASYRIITYLALRFYRPRN